MSFLVTWLPPATYSLVESETHRIRQFSAFYSHFQVTSGQITSLPGHFRSPETRDVISSHVTASSGELQPCRKWNGHYTPIFGLLQPLPGDFRSNDVTSGHLKSRDIISCHVTASSCDLQPCGKSNAQYTQVFGLLLPFPGDCWSNDVSSGSLPIIWGQVTSFSTTWLPPPASYSLVWSQTHSIRQFSHLYSQFQVTSNQMNSLPGQSRSQGQLTSFPVMWLPPPASDSLVKCQTHSIRQFWPSTPTSRWFRWNDVTSGSLPITWGYLPCFPVTWLPPASYSLVGSKTHSILQFSAFYNHLQVTSVKSRHFWVTSGHLRSPDVIFCNVTASCELQPCRKSNGQYTPVFGLLQPLPGRFRSNDITSESLPVTWGHVTSFPVTWLPLPASNSLVGS